VTTKASSPSPAQPVEPLSRRRRARTFAVAGIALIVVLLAAAAAGWHLYATSAYDRSFTASLPLAQRAAAAALARRLEPWNGRFATRDDVMRGWLLGSQLMAQRKYLAAVDTLAAAYRQDVGDRELLALFVKAQDLLTVDTNWKAHVQHAREGPGGSLRPQDVIP
jgi:hypothetical protein